MSWFKCFTFFHAVLICVETRLRQFELPDCDVLPKFGLGSGYNWGKKAFYIPSVSRDKKNNAYKLNKHVHLLLIMFVIVL